jgi:hypothetical protein
MSSLPHGRFTAISPSDRNTLETGKLKREMEIKCSPALTSGSSNPPEMGPYKESLLVEKIHTHRSTRRQASKESRTVDTLIPSCLASCPS